MNANEDGQEQSREGDLQGWPHLGTCRGLCDDILPSVPLTPGCSREGYPEAGWRGGGKAWVSPPWRATPHQHFTVGGSTEEQKELGPRPWV